MGKSTGGIRKQVLRLAANPPDGYETAGIVGPEGLSQYFSGHRFIPWRGLRPWKETGPELLHAHGLTAAARAALGLMLHRFDIPLVVTVHTARSQTLRAGSPLGRLEPAQALMWAAGRFAMRRARAVVVPSQHMAEEVNTTAVIPPPIDLPAPGKPRGQVRKQLGTPEAAVVVLAVGRLHPDKALDVFIEALAGTDAAGWIAGEGPDRPRLEQLAKGSNVRLLGQRSDIGSLLAAADLFALPARSEAYGFAVLEAVAFGLPVVATRTGAVAELVGDAGIVVEPEDRAAFIAAVHKMIEDEPLRASFAQKARSRTLPSPRELTRRLGAVYDQVLQRGP